MWVHQRRSMIFYCRALDCFSGLGGIEHGALRGTRPFHFEKLLPIEQIVFLTFLFWGCIIWGQINKSFAATLTTTYFICHEFSSISFSFVCLLFLCLYLQDDHKAFRRQLEDKRPIVESNLTSGRQYIASEAPVSDTSDTEGKFNEIPLNYYVRVHSGLTDSKRWPQKTPWICKHYFKLTFTIDTISDGLHYS